MKKKRTKSKAALMRELKVAKEERDKLALEVGSYRTYAASLFKTATTIQPGNVISKDNVIHKLYEIFRVHGAPMVYWETKT